MADLTIRFVGDVKPLAKATKEAEHTLGGFSGKVSGFGKSIAGGILGGGAVLAGFHALKGAVGDVFAEARESVRVGKLTAAVIKSTGGAAHVSAAQVDELANALSVKTGIDDEAIASSANLLLTFTNVRNEVGKGNDIFNQATKVVQDMSVALGQDGKASAIQLGKALNDPIKGITALRRVGVSFTKAQLDQIKVLVASGKTLEAQKLILHELGREFGGAAEASADPMQKLGVVVKNLEEKIGLALLPTINKLADWLGRVLPPIIDTLSRWVGENLPKAFEKVRSIFEDVFGGAKKLIEDLAHAFGVSQKTIVIAIAAIAAGLIGLAIAWNAGPGIIVTGVVLLAGALLYAYNRFTWFRDGVNGVLQAIGFVTRSVVEGAIRAWNALHDSPVWPLLVANFKLIRDAVQWFADHWGPIWRNMSAVLRTEVEGMTRVLQPFVDAVDRVADAAKRAGDIISHFPIIGGGEQFPNLGQNSSPQRQAPGRKLASGGIVTRPTFALVGESGPEAVIPLSRAKIAATNSPNVSVNVSVVNPTGDGREIARQVYEALSRGFYKAQIQQTLGVA